MSPPTPPAKSPYKTTDFYLACYLIFLKVRLRAVEPTGPNRVVFVFDEYPEELILDYYNHAPLGEASFLDVVEATRHTRELLYHALDQRR